MHTCLTLRSPPTITNHAYHCFLRECKVSLSINAAFEVSQISASVVYNLNLPSIFDKSGLQRSSVDIKAPTVTGFYISQMDVVVSYGLSSDMLLASDWILLCKPVFINDHPFISDPTPETAQVLPYPHSWQLVNGSFLPLMLFLSPDIPTSYHQSGSTHCNLPA